MRWKFNLEFEGLLVTPPEQFIFMVMLRSVINNFSNLDDNPVIHFDDADSVNDDDDDDDDDNNEPF